MVDQQGNAATYTYDAVGNILAIARFDAGHVAAPVAITLVSPDRGRPDTTVAIFGKGFSSDITRNTVTFNGTPAPVTAAAPNRLATSVPSEAGTGLITVTTPLGTAVSATVFRVLGALEIDPAGAVVAVGASRQFLAREQGNEQPRVAWSVDGITGGRASVGTVSATGLYTAPPILPSPPTVTLAARDLEAPASVRTVSIFLVAAPLDVFVPTTRVSVRPTPAPAPPAPATTAAPAVSVGSAPGSAPPPPVVTVAAPVSVRGPAGPDAAAPLMAAAPPVSLDVARASSSPPTTIAAPALALALEPVVTGVVPSGAGVGVTDLALAVTGAGFAGASALTFSRNGVADGGITVSALAVEPDGSVVTARISVAAGASAGGRVLQIVTPRGVSTPLASGLNVFTLH